MLPPEVTVVVPLGEMLPPVPALAEIVKLVGAADCTVSPALPVIPFDVAVMVTLPALTAVTRPELLTVATLVLEEDHVAWLDKFCVLPSE